MLYPKSQTVQLSDALFQNPGSEYRAAPFWAWNCRLDSEELLWQLDVLKEMGMGGAHLHVRTGLATPYLSDAFFLAVKQCVKKCQQENMQLWLYDEDRWPSGAAGGLVTKDHQYRARHLLMTPFPYKSDEKSPECTRVNGTHCRTANGTLLKCYDILLNKDGCLKEYRVVNENEPVRGTRWYAYLETAVDNPWYNGQSYVNTLDPAAIRKFIQVTHESYYKHFGDHFGKLIPAIFTDEPQFTHKTRLNFPDELTDIILPWTEDLPKTFFQTYGEDLLLHLPQLIWQLPENKSSVLRYQYHDHICELFAEAYADQCGNWCADHGIMLTGHMMKEPTLESQTTALGEAMRHYRSFQLPGVDMLRNRTEFTTVKQAQSAAHQYGREGVLSELYGVTGWDFDFRGHKFQGDWQAALGVTVRVPHLSMVSMKGESKRDYPASFNYQSPWWQDYACIEDHFARIATAMTRGTPLVRVGVIHPIESYWLNFGPRSQTGSICDRLDRQFQQLTRWLLQSCIDFDFISESLLPELCPHGDAPLRVGVMSYDVIVVPECHTLRSTTLDRLESFKKAGGTLIFLGNPPVYEDALPSPRGEMLWNQSMHIDFTQSSLLRALESHRLVGVYNEDGSLSDAFMHQLRLDRKDRWLFLAHATMPDSKATPCCKNIRIVINGCYNVLCYNTLSGEIHPMQASVRHGKTEIQASLFDLDSLLLRLTVEPVATYTAPPVYGHKDLPVPALADFSLDEPNVLLLDKAQYALDDAPYRPEQELLRVDTLLRTELGWRLRIYTQIQPWAMEACTPVHKLRLRFCVYSDFQTETVRLALEDAQLAEIYLNGIRIPSQCDGWFTDKAISTVPLGRLQAGENHIEVIFPFSKTTNIEWCYLLGAFGVRCQGQHRNLIPLAKQLYFDSILHQGLPHYGGNITYHIPVNLTGNRLRVQIPDYDGTAIRVELQGQKSYIIYPPYQTVLEDLLPGQHTLQLTLLGNRSNCFGPVHMVDPQEPGSHPRTWHTTGEKWTEAYCLSPIGINRPPIIQEEYTPDALSSSIFI